MFSASDNLFMRMALEQANKALALDEVPIGAVLVLNDEVIAVGCNAPISQCDPTAHAEIVCLRNAATRVGNYRLNEAVLYTTLEPCVMCAGAMVHARIAKCVFAAHDLRAGAVETQFAISNSPVLNHQIQSVGGLMAEESVALLQDFFKRRRLV